MGPACLRSSLGNPDDVLVLGQRRDVDAVRIPLVRRRLLPAVLQSWSDWSSGKWYQVAIAIVLTWAVVGVGIMRLEVGKWVNNIGAMLKVVIILAIGIGGVVFAIRHGAANHIGTGDIVPSFHVAKSFLPVIVYMLIGFELVSSMGDEIKDPEKQIPRAFFTSGALTAFLYVFATVGILLSLSLHKLTLVQGLVDTFKAIFGSHGAGEVAVYVLGIGALYTYFTNMTTWSMGANRAVAEAANDGELPSFFAREDPAARHARHRVPHHRRDLDGRAAHRRLFIKQPGLAVLRDLCRVLRRVPASVPTHVSRCARAAGQGSGPPPPVPDPGRYPVVGLLAAVATFVIAATALFFMWPEFPHRPADWSYTGPLLGIVAGALIIGEVLIWRGLHRVASRRSHRRHPPAGFGAAESPMSMTHDSTPSADGFRMPAEWEPHDGCWMVWPERPDNWRWGAKPAQAAYAAVANAIAASEPVTMAVSSRQFEHCRSLLDPASGSSR